jgi:hypothetical protein
LSERWKGLMRFTYRPKESELRGVICPLCQEDIAPGQIMLGRHLGRHMEEISFAVVTRPYEEWKFYDDTIAAGTWISLHRM